MHRERISDDVYVFTSGLYAQVTASAIVTNDGVVVIDTLPFPNETRQVIEYIERRAPVKYVIYTHYHADHTYGGYLFRNAQFIAHELCRELLITRGEAGLKLARAQNPSLADVQLRLPDIVFTGEMTLRLGGKTSLCSTRRATRRTASPSTPRRQNSVRRRHRYACAVHRRRRYTTMLNSFAGLKGYGAGERVQGHGRSYCAARSTRRSTAASTTSTRCSWRWPVR
jgi:hypothetical protein